MKATGRGHDAPDIKAGVTLERLKDDHGPGRGHGTDFVHVIKKGPQIGSRHVDTTGSHRDESDLPWLDRNATRPQ